MSNYRVYNKVVSKVSLSKYAILQCPRWRSYNGKRLKKDHTSNVKKLVKLNYYYTLIN